MAKRYQFKNPDSVMTVPGLGRVTNDNMSKEIYDKLVALNPVHADMFEEKEVEPLFISKKDDNKTQKLKPHKNDVQA